VCLAAFAATNSAQTAGWKSIDGQVSKAVPFSVTENLSEGAFGAFSIEQSVADILVAVTGPNGQIFETASANSIELAVWRADVAGEYKLTVKHVGGPERSTVRITRHSLGPVPQIALAAFEKQLSGRKKYDSLDVIKAAAAIDDLEAAFGLWKQSAFKLGEAAAAFDLAYTYNAAGDLTNAAKYLLVADAVWQSGKFETAMAATCNLAAAIALRRSQFPESIHFADRAIAVYRKLGDTQGETEMLMLIGNYYSSTGEYDFALTNYELAIENWKKLGNQHRVAATLNNIGLLYSEQGNRSEALKYFELSLATFRADRPNTRGEANVLVQLGYFYLDRIDAKRAGEYFDMSLPIWRRITDPYAEATALVGAATVKMLVGDTVGSRSMFNEALSLARQRGSKGGEISANYGLARLERKVGDLDGSLGYIKKATELIESTRDSMVDQQSRYGYFGRSQRIYDFYVDLLVESGDTEAAFLISERSRARALVEMIASSTKLSKNRVDSKLFEQEAELRQQANAAEQLRATAILQRRPKEVVDNAAAKLTGILRDLSAVQDLIKKSSPEYSELIGSNMSDLATIQRELLDERTQLLEFKLGDERSHLFVVSRTRIQVFKLPGRDVLNKAAVEFVQDISSRLTPVDRVNESTKRISDTLFADARKYLTGDRLLIVAEGSLNSVPFAALKLDDGEYLIDRSEIVMLPSAETLLSVRKYARNSAKPAKVLVLADPIYQSTDTRFALRAPGANKTENKFPMLGRLPATRKEGRSVADLFGANSMVITDLDASRANFIGQELSRFAYIHVAAHGVLSDRRPELSGVVLSAFDKKGTPVDALLSLNDIYDLRLSAEMVVLSACESGLGRDVRGEGVIGMNRGFLFAGSRRVVSSLWKIDDVATGALMTELYGNMLGAGKVRPAAALRAAQLALKKQRRFGSPFYWAGLTLTGEWQ